MRCEKLAGRDQVFGVSNLGGREESCCSGHGLVVVKILIFQGGEFRTVYFKAQMLKRKTPEFFLSCLSCQM